jgi:hypothetical protein
MIALLLLLFLLVCGAFVVAAFVTLALAAAVAFVAVGATVLVLALAVGLVRFVIWHHRERDLYHF